jgi:hypothetical protein
MMKKKKKKERHEDCGHEVDSINNVYMFHNLKFNLHLFINAMDLEDAMNQLDILSLIKDKNLLSNIT